MRKWDGQGREYAKAHMPIYEDADEMLATLKDWDERMQDRAYLRRIKGWILTTRTWHGQHRFLSHLAHDRGRMLREFFAASHIDVDTQTLICGLTSRHLDKFLKEFKPRNTRDKYQLQERLETHIAKISSRMSENAVGWYDDTKATPFPWDEWNVHRMLGKCWQYEWPGSRDDGWQHRRETAEEDWQDRWRRNYNEITGRSDDHVPDWYTAVDSVRKQDEWYDPCHYAEAPGSHAPTDKGRLNTPQYKIAQDRTTHFNDALVAQMDERNVRRLECLEQWVQRDVIHTYAPKDGKQIRDINKYLGAVIGCFQRMAQSGLVPDESARRIELSRTGRRMKYHTCYSFGKHGTCKYERDCCNVHIDGIYESD